MFYQSYLPMVVGGALLDLEDQNKIMCHNVVVVHCAYKGSSVWKTGSKSNIIRTSFSLSNYIYMLTVSLIHTSRALRAKLGRTKLAR